MKISKLKENYIHIFGSAILFTIFMLLFKIYGVIFAPDSNGYIQMSIAREPLYPLFLTLIRTIFNRVGYEIVVILQILLAVYASFSFSKNISKRFNIIGYHILSIYFLIYLYYFIFLPFSVLLPYISGIVVYPISILTEGITYSIYLLYAKSLILAGVDKDYKNLFLSLVYAVTMSLTRTSLIPTIIAAILVGLFIAFNSKYRIKRSITVIIAGVSCFVFMFAFENLYFKINYGRFMTHTYGPVTALSNILYTAEEDDEKLFDDDNIKKIFAETYKIIKENGWNYKSDSGLIETGEHMKMCHDNIKFNAFDKVMELKFQRSGISSPVDRELYRDNIAKKMSKVLIKKHFGRWCKNYTALIVQGIIKTVAYAPHLIVMQVYSFLIILLYIVGMIIFRKNKSNLAYLLITALLMLGIICSASLVIMCLSRYMIYNFVIFYTGFVIMWCNRKTKS